MFVANPPQPHASNQKPDVVVDFSVPDAGATKREIKYGLSYTHSDGSVTKTITILKVAAAHARGRAAHVDSERFLTSG